MNKLLSNNESNSKASLRAKIFNVQLQPNKLDKEELKKIINSSMNKTSDFNNCFINRKIITKKSMPLSLFHKKYNSLDGNLKYISKTKRIRKYNPNNLISKNELILETRSHLLNNRIYNKSNRKKISYDENNNKDYNIYKVSYKLKPEKFINKTHEKIDKNHKTYLGFYNSINNNGNYFYHKLPQQDKHSLYSILARRKNQFMDSFYKCKDLEEEYLPNFKNLRFLTERTPMANYYSKKNDIRTYISPNKIANSYISLLNDDYSISEKIRFQKIMSQLTKVKNCIEEKPEKDKDIVKEFLLSIGLYRINNLREEKLKNFIDFIKGDFIINPSKNMKENILDIINGKTVIRPALSDIMIPLNNKESDELMNKNNINKSIKKNKKSHRVESVERIMKKKYIELKRNNSLSNLTPNQKKIISNYKSLPHNLKKQEEILSSSKNTTHLDLVSHPQYIIDMLEKKFNKEKKFIINNKDKTNSTNETNLNRKFLGLSDDNNYNYDEIRKKNLLTEYVCLMKAKNNFEISKLKEKYNLKNI